MKKLFTVLFLAHAALAYSENIENRLPAVFDGAKMNSELTAFVQAGQKAQAPLLQEKISPKNPAVRPVNSKELEESRRQTAIGLIAGGAAFAGAMAWAIASFQWGALMVMLPAFGFGALIGFAAIGLYLLFK